MNETVSPVGESASPSAVRAFSCNKAIALLILAGLCAYCNSFNKAFVYDDLFWIGGDMNPAEGWRYVRMMIYRPLIGLSIVLNYQMGGLTTPSYHALNLAIHILAGLTLFGVVRRTLLLERWQGRFTDSATWLAFVIALWWLVHPLTTQAVTYVIQRCESMMGLFYLLTLYCVLRSHTSSWPRCWCVAAVVAALCSAAAKQVAATIPLVILLFDWMFLADSFRQILKKRWGLYAGLLSIWAVVVICTALGPSTEETNAGFGLRGVTPYRYLLTQAGVLVYYLRLCFWPWPLCLSYHGWPLAESLSEVLPQGLVILTLLLLTVWAVVRRWWPGFLGAWFFLILAPTSSFMPVADYVFEHRMYLSLIAVIALVVLSGHALAQRHSGRLRDPARRAALSMAIVAGVALTLGVLTFLRNEAYRSEITLWRDAIDRFPANYFAKKCLGNALTKEGKTDEALPWLRQGFEELPDAVTLFFIGQLYARKGDVDTAVDYFEQALRMNSYHAPSHNDLGIALFNQGKVKEAVQHLRRATYLNPSIPLYHRNLAHVLFELGEKKEATIEYRRSLRFDPGFPDRSNRAARAILLSDALANGDGKQREVLQREVLMMALNACRATDYRNPEMIDTLAIAYAANGRFDDAVAAVKTGIEVAKETEDSLWLSVLPERLKLYEKHRMLRDKS